MKSCSYAQTVIILYNKKGKADVLPFLLYSLFMENTKPDPGKDYARHIFPDGKPLSHLILSNHTSYEFAAHYEKRRFCIGGCCFRSSRPEVIGKSMGHTLECCPMLFPQKVKIPLLQGGFIHANETCKILRKS